MGHLTPEDIIQEMISPEAYFPGNPNYPLLIYKQVFSAGNETPKEIQTRLERNNWDQSWIDSIYDFHHYHSSTHEVLVIISGDGQVQFGGEQGSTHTISAGDVVIIPAGVAHKSLNLSDNFRCIGAYPFNISVDMKLGRVEEYLKAIETVKQIGLPKKDPVFGEKGLLFDYWHSSK
ncbi:cupin domain-containing protein [Legionella drozanskii]|uniref:Cupin domain protein n=1 Tax=Legionella drozanskii LLAP-1 TaxID=1212489 RepID=A0A0W0SXL5_9GAMM|nr:cupin domain-containing protein [Legionella drozanskii]KTC87685.1 Cupin domain protein [Legionella drozanskii LLAP-1]